MGRIRYKYREVVGSIYSKLPVPEGQWRSSKERNAPIIIDGIQISRVTIPKTKGGGSDIRTGTLNSIRNQLLLCRDQFVDFVDCPMTTTDYINKMKAKFPDTFETINQSKT